MHQYACFSHDRVRVGRYIGAASVLGVSFASRFFDFFSSYSGWEFFSKISLTSGAIYFLLHFLFEKVLWRFSFFEVPNVSGVWDVSGKTLNEDGSTRYEWAAVIKIKQDWQKISICLDASKSKSESVTAIINKKNGPVDGWRVSYGYLNEPKIGDIHELNMHRGYCEVDFDSSVSIGDASYFNSSGRRTFGNMRWVRRKG